MSDRGVVPKKLPNKAAGEIPAAAEVVGTALAGIRQTTQCRRGAKFAGLLHHICAVVRLEQAYRAVKREAAAGVDGQTWQSYGQDLQRNVLDLSDRLARGGCRPQPVKRVYIDKAEGRKRPPTVGRLRLRGVPALEDKIVQRATVEVLNAIYEQGFLGFSYGFRPGKSAHNAPDAVAAGVSARKLNAVLDADISKFFDTIEHDWLIKFIEHGVADARVVRRTSAKRLHKIVAQGLPSPRICHPYPNQRLIVTTQGSSRTR